jgi:serine/threonine-protein kinase HipA
VVAQSLVGALPDALSQVKARLGDEARLGTERTLLERLTRWITTNTRKQAKRWGLHT